MRWALVLALALAGPVAGQHVEGLYSTGLFRLPDVILYNPVRRAVLVGSHYGPTGVVEVYIGGRRVGLKVPLEDKVQALEYCAAAGRVYCAHVFSDEVSVLDAATLDVLGVVRVGDAPRALLAVGDRVYCANSGSNSVSVIHAGPDTVRATLDCGAYPVAFCHNPASGKVYLACTNGNRVTVLDVAGDSVLAQVTVGSSPVALCWDPDHNRVYCANRASENVSVIDGVTNARLRHVPVGRFPQSVGWLASAGKVYVPHSVSDTVAVIRCGPDTVEAMLPVGDGGFSVVPDAAHDRVFALGRYDDNISVIDGATNLVLGTLAADSAPYAACLDPAGDTLFVALYGTDEVAAYDAAGARPAGRASLSGRYPTGICSSPDGSRLWIANYRSDNVAVFDPAAKVLLGLLPAGDGPSEVACDPTGARVYCVNALGNNVTVIDAAGDSTRATLATGGRPRELCPGGSDRVYCGQDFGGSDTVFALAGDSVAARFKVGAPCHSLAWAPGANRLYIANRGSDDVSVIDLATGAVVATIAVPDPAAICLGPDSSKVYCAASESCAVWVLDVAGDSVCARVPVEEEPTVLEAIPGGRWVYCACFLNTRNLQVIDAGADTLAGYVNIGWQPAHLFYSAPSNMLFCGYFPMNPDSTVKVVDCSTNRVAASLQTALYPGGFAASVPNDRVFLTLNTDGRLAVIHDAVTAVGEGSALLPVGGRAAGTILGVADLARLDCRVLDITGRDVTDRREHLSPGVYFLHSAPGIGHSSLVTAKVIVQR